MKHEKINMKNFQKHFFFCELICVLQTLVFKAANYKKGILKLT